MSRSKKASGKRVQVNVLVDNTPVSTIVFGKASGHPFSQGWEGENAETDVTLAGVFWACVLMVLDLGTDANFEAGIEFMEQLLQEALIAEEEGDGSPSPTANSGLPF